jgi:hypothetical protein
MKTHREKCGCKSERGTGRERWLELCEPHRAEAQELHAQHEAFMASRRASTTLPEEGQE